MAWTFTPTTIIRGEQTVEVFGSLAFSGNYATGGDASGILNQVGAGTGGWPQFAPATPDVPASFPPIAGVVHLDQGYSGVFIPGAGVLPSKIKIYSAAGTELTAAAYPAALTGGAQSTAALTFRKSL